MPVPWATCWARIAVWAAAALVGWPAPAAAAVRSVTDPGDTGAPGQLRTEIELAQPGDVILVGPIHVVLAGAAGDDANLSGDLDIIKDLSIQGAGAGRTIVDGGGVDRVFHVRNGVTVAISGLTVRNGNPGVNASGGGIAVGDGTLLLTSALVSDNTADAFGGGLSVAATGAATLSAVALTGNFAGIHGGGVSARGPVNLTNVTISGNRADAFGGGIAALDATGIVTLGNVTITDNDANADGSGTQEGGGIYVGSGQAILRNTILAGNRVGAGGSGPDCAGPLTSRGSNLIQAVDPPCVVSAEPPTAADVIGVDAGLEPLELQGGTTPTHALLPGSLALDAGDGACAPTDQRGVSRPRGPRCDIGAYEAARGGSREPGP